MESTVTCPQCHSPNRPGAKFCAKCGHTFVPATAATTVALENTAPVPVNTSTPNASSTAGKSSGLLDQLRRLKQQILPSPEPPPPLTVLPGGSLQPQASYSCAPPFPQHVHHFYATDQAGRAFLAHELATPLDEPNGARSMAQLSSELPGMRRVHDVIGLPDGRTFVLVEPPQDSWHFASDPRDEPVAPEVVTQYGLQIGRTLDDLHRHGYALNDNTPAALERVVLDGHAAFLIDFLTCVRLPEDEAQKRQMISADIGFLARLLYRLVTRHHLPNSSQDLRGLVRLPRPLRVAILWGAKNNYVSMSEMLTHLSGHNLPPLRLASGKATHPGRLRDHNEDQFFVYEVAKGRSDQPLPAFYMVADGMGGHEAGEVASDTISASLKDWLDEFSNRKAGRATQKLGEQPDEALKTAIQAANLAVFKQAQARHNNMGATVTAALIVGEQAFIANVGDSRTYLLRNRRLTQITTDHSLVFSLFKAGQITQDEIYTHPQRNQIYRSLGERQQVDVDVFTETLESGDILLLCSDGLWEMVRDAGLRNMLDNARTPQEIADQLMVAANRGGGEDNITAIVVRVDM